MADDLATVRLVLAILRAEGVAFADAWTVAQPRPLAHRDRVALRAALDAWRRAYSNAAPPTAGERAAARIAALWRERDDGAEDRGELVGARCG